MTKEIKCSCSHTFQDKVYGQGVRVHNAMKKVQGATEQPYRCTVCGSEKRVRP